MPKMRMYRLSSTRPLRRASQGSTCSRNIGSSSRGGPGRWITVLPAPMGTMAPGAVPRRFISTSASGVNMAWARLFSGISRPSWRKRSRTMASASGRSTSA